MELRQRRQRLASRVPLHDSAKPESGRVCNEGNHHRPDAVALCKPMGGHDGWQARRRLRGVEGGVQGETHLSD